MVAIVVISQSEIKEVIPEFESHFEQTNEEDFKKLLWNLGLDTNRPYEKQTDLTHRNRLNKIVCCDRWVGSERIDNDWITSSYASREAKLEASGSKMVRDLDPHKYHDL